MLYSSQRNSSRGVLWRLVWLGRGGGVDQDGTGEVVWVGLEWYGWGRVSMGSNRSQRLLPEVRARGLGWITGVLGGGR